MIKAIELFNIQSHKHSKIDFEKGVNSIIGNSCAGKTAILRALYWIVYNRPQGTSILCSNWNKDAKGNPKDEMSAILYTDKGWVKRYRNFESNGYVVHYNDGTENVLEAVRTDVPEEVQKFLNIGDINVQKQMDSPFLLSESAPEAARFLNSLVHLDSIDVILSRGEKDKRDVNGNIKFVDSELQKKRIKLESLNFVEDAESLIERINKFNKQIVSLDKEILELTSDISKFDGLKDYSKGSNLISEIESIVIDNKEIEKLSNEIEIMDKKLNSYSDAQEIVDRIEKFDIPDSFELSDEIDEYEDCLDKLSWLTKCIDELKEELPDVCPYCGHKLEECNEGNNYC